MTDPEVILQPHNAHTRKLPAPAASEIDIPVQSYIIPDETTARLIRLEAKIDAQGAQINWVVSTVTQFVEGIKHSPMAGMLAKRMGN